jgi:hypothetical protein
VEWEVWIWVEVVVEEEDGVVVEVLIPLRGGTRYFYPLNMVIGTS